MTFTICHEVLCVSWDVSIAHHSSLHNIQVTLPEHLGNCVDQWQIVSRWTLPWSKETRFVLRLWVRDGGYTYMYCPRRRVYIHVLSETEGIHTCTVRDGGYTYMYCPRRRVYIHVLSETEGIHMWHLDGGSINRSDGGWFPSRVGVMQEVSLWLSWRPRGEWRE